MKAYETVIGLEVHVELATRSKIFCGCSTKFGGEPNTQVCPVCAGMPGTLPVLNKSVVEYAVAAGLALNCNITQRCKFDRKNYFYPDLPKAYQISQLYLPICRDGQVEIETQAGKKIVRIHEIHMEEDAGKLIHDPWDDCTLVDFNRCGVPLIEIVSEPDMRSAEEAIAYLEKLRLILQYLGVSDCKMQEGSMRADINLSVRELGSNKLGTRTEMKNMNSFKAIARAIEGERKRQIELLEYGKPVIQETRRWDDNKDTSFAMRSKEDAQDYRYFPEPDLPPVYIDDEWISSIKARQPELRDEKMLRYVNEFGLPAYDASIITGSKHLADLFEDTVALCNKPKEVSNWLMVETLRLLKEKEMDPEDISFSPAQLASVIKMVDEGKINRTVAKDVFEKVFCQNVNPEEYVEQQGLGLVSDDSLLKDTICRIIADNPQSVADYKKGKVKAMGFIVGQTMREMKGKADPEKVNSIVRELLDNI
jgi:aspartyl-tRNA(Asn)/glutamyl-tRNA(Gln) amidotransferase subunit B